MRYLVAIRAASSAASKQSAGVAGASTATGDSPLRPYSAMQQVGLLGLGRHAGGRPGPLDVADDQRQLERDGQADRLGLERHAGPEVVVTPSAPPNDAPSAAPTPAISSSAWNVRTPKRLCLDSSCRMSEAGVIG